MEFVCVLRGPDDDAGHTNQTFIDSQQNIENVCWLFGRLRYRAIKINPIILIDSYRGGADVSNYNIHTKYGQAKSEKWHRSTPANTLVLFLFFSLFFNRAPKV